MKSIAVKELTINNCVVVSLVSRSRTAALRRTQTDRCKRTLILLLTITVASVCKNNAIIGCPSEDLFGERRS